MTHQPIPTEAADPAPLGARLIDLAAPGPVVLPPQSTRFKSRVVALAPGASVGLHTTHRREELVVVLEGRGELRLPATEEGGRTLPLVAGKAAYVPPETPHDIANTGSGPLRYLYVVALLD